MKKNGYSPIVISGPSGTGKTVLIDYIEKNTSNYIEAIGFTTRNRRPGESAKMKFLTKKEFEELIKENNLIEYCLYNGNYYGVSKEEYKKLQDYHVIFNVAYSSAQNIKRDYNDTLMIYLLSPTVDELKKRLGDRGIERFNLGMKETIENAFKYEYLLISKNQDLEGTMEDFLDIAEQKSTAYQKKLILAKNRDFINNFYK